MDTLVDLGIEVSLVDVTDVKAVEQAFQSNTRMVFAETIANPVTQVADLAAIGRLCKSKGAVYLVDNTMTPGCILDASEYRCVNDCFIAN